MRRGTPTRLELHRLKFHHRGMVGEMLAFSDLDSQERVLITQDIFKNIHLRPDQNPYEVVSEVFAHWGVSCNHPMERRLYEGRERSSLPTARFRWFYCESCRCYSRNDAEERHWPTRRPG